MPTSSARSATPINGLNQHCGVATLVGEAGGESKGAEWGGVVPRAVLVVGFVPSMASKQAPVGIVQVTAPYTIPLLEANIATELRANEPILLDTFASISHRSGR